MLRLLPLMPKERLTTVTSATITPSASSITGGQALTKTDDTNVTLNFRWYTLNCVIGGCFLNTWLDGNSCALSVGAGNRWPADCRPDSSSPLYKSITGDVAITAGGVTSVNSLHSGALQTQLHLSVFLPSTVLPRPRCGATQLRR